MSASSRTVTFSLVGALCLSRLRRYCSTMCGKTSIAGLGGDESRQCAESSGSRAMPTLIAVSSPYRAAISGSVRELETN